jgi:cell division protein FtsX
LPLPPFETLGRLLLVLGLVIAGLGLLMMLVGRWPPLGRLPGDIFIQRDNTTIWIPIATSLLLSLVLSLILTIIVLLSRR